MKAISKLLTVAAMTATIFQTINQARADEPIRLTTSTPTNLCYFDDRTNSTKCETFEALDVFFDPFQPSTYIEDSPTDPTRTLEALPTFGLAAYHHWLFDLQLKRAQRRYAAVVERIATLQRLYNLYRQPHEPEAVILDSRESSIVDVINSIREYEVPFNPIATERPERPPTRLEAIEHAKAAAYSHNLTVFHIGLASVGLELWEKKLYDTINARISAR